MNPARLSGAIDISKEEAERRAEELNEPI